MLYRILFALHKTCNYTWLISDTFWKIISATSQWNMVFNWFIDKRIDSATLINISSINRNSKLLIWNKQRQEMSSAHVANNIEIFVGTIEIIRMFFVYDVILNCLVLYFAHHFCNCVKKCSTVTEWKKNLVHSVNKRMVFINLTKFWELFNFDSRFSRK